MMWRRKSRLSYIGKFVRELRSGDVDAFLTRLKAFFADFPYELKAKTECHYQVVFYLVFKLMGQFCDAKVRGAKGRADAVVKTKDYIYVGNYIPVYTSLSIIITNSHKLIGIEFVRNKERR